MNPLFTIAAGVVVGILGVHQGQRAVARRSNVVKTDPDINAIRNRVVTAGEALRQAAIAGLSAVEKRSGGLRQRLDDEPDASAPTTHTHNSPERQDKPTKASKTVARKRK